MRLSILLCSMLTINVLAQEFDTSGLTKEQVAKLQLNAEQMKSSKSVDMAKEYVELGEMIGKALGSTAREMNVAVNDFAQTPVGKLSMVLIIWKVIGREGLHYLVGSLIMIIGLWMWVYYFRRLCFIQSIEYGTGWWIFRAKKIIYIDKPSDDINVTRVIMFLILIGIFTASMVAMWNT